MTRRAFKDTEVGPIPEDWDVAVVASLLAAPIQNGVFNEPSRKGRGCKLINVIDLYRSFPIDTKELERFDASQDEVVRFGVKHGDMFFTRSSLTPDGIAQCNIYQAKGEEPVVFDCHIIRVRPNNTKAEPFFLARYCTSRRARGYLVTNSKTTTMTTIDQSVIAKLPVALPSLPEQRAIAEALSDVDALLGSLGRLIAKKRNLKQAAQQQLLTGRTRLPGFGAKGFSYKQSVVGVIPEDWVVAQIIDLKPFVTSGSRGWASYYSDRGSLFVRITNLSRKSIYLGLDDSKFVKLPPEAREGTRTQLQQEDVLISITADIGIVGYVDCRVPLPAYINQHIALVRFDSSRTSGKFVSYFLASEKPQKLFRASTDVGAKAGMSLLTVQKLQLALPAHQEQTAIAEVLTDMDAELAALDQRREKTRALKQAMMQELLTGRTRLL